MVIAISSYLVLLGWVVMPMLPDAFRETRIEAQVVQAVRAVVPGVLYAGDIATNHNMLAYVTGTIRVLPVSEIAKITEPALAILIPGELAVLASQNPGLRIVVQAALERKTGSKLFALYPAVR